MNQDKKEFNLIQGSNSSSSPVPKPQSPGAGEQEVKKVSPNATGVSSSSKNAANQAKSGQPVHPSSQNQTPLAPTQVKNTSMNHEEKKTANTLVNTPANKNKPSAEIKNPNTQNLNSSNNSPRTSRVPQQQNSTQHPSPPQHPSPKSQPNSPQAQQRQSNFSPTSSPTPNPQSPTSNGQAQGINPTPSQASNPQSQVPNPPPQQARSGYVPSWQQNPVNQGNINNINNPNNYAPNNNPNAGASPANTNFPPNPNNPAPGQVNQNLNYNNVPQGNPNQPNQKGVNPPPGNAGKKHSRSGFILGCFGIGSFLLVLFLFLMILMVSQGGENNALLKLFGGEQGQLKSFLLAIINVIFGIISLVSIVVLIIGIFRRMLAFQDKEERSRAFKMMIFGGIILSVSVASWIFLYYFVGQIKVQTIKKKESVIFTEPENTSNLSAPIDVSFTAEPNLRNIQQYSWDFDGDGRPDGHGKNVVWRYKDKGKDNSGRFNVRLVVTYLDSSKEEATKEYSHFVFISNEKTKAVFTANPEKGRPPLEVFFNATESTDPDGEILSYRWDLDGDGKFDEEGKTLTHTFERTGKYDVLLQVEDNNREIAEYTRTIFVDSGKGEKPKAEFQVVPETLGEAPFEVSLDASDSSSRVGKIAGYEWDFGDNTLKGRSKTTKHTYEEPGKYELKLKVKNSVGGEDEKIVLINVLAKSKAPKAIINTNPKPEQAGQTLEIVVPADIEFDASKSTDSDENIVEYLWDFDGDGQEDETGMNVSRTFSEAGEFEISLTVVDADDNKDTTSVKIKTSKDEYEAILELDKFNGSVPLKVTFDGSKSRAPESDPIISYEWSFGETGKNMESVFYGARITHEYSEVGDFIPKLTIHTKSGKTFSSKSKVVAREVAIEAKFKVSEEMGKAPLVVSFDPSPSSGPIVEYFWDFGNGGTSDEIRPLHTFRKPGVYTVTLTAKDRKSNISTYEEKIVVLSKNEEEGS